MDKGKVYGDGEGYTIDPGSVKSLHEWRKMCEQSYAVIPSYSSSARSEAETKDLLQGDHWDAPTEPTNSNGPLRRPHLQN